MKCHFCDWERVLTDLFYQGFSQEAAITAIGNDYTNHLLEHLIIRLTAKAGEKSA